METIYAPATARGKAGVAIIRLSGPRAWAAVEAMTGSLPAPREIGLRSLRAGTGEVLDTGLVVVFEHGHSFTGEQSAELHLHGSQAVVTAVLRALGTMAGLRVAEAGEFTRRALMNDRMDLAQVEGLGDLIEAETEAQRRQAVKVLSGAIGARAEGWRNGLLRAVALVEAGIDFADEDVPSGILDQAAVQIRDVQCALEAECAGQAAAERVRDGFEVAIVGRPNVGKSTLLNMIAGRDAAITSAFAGTTRDVLEVRLELEGLAVTLLDTAGLREGTDALERIGVSRARERADAADLRIFLITEEGDEMALGWRPGDVVRSAKGDLGWSDGLSVSGLTGAGVGELLSEIGKRLEARVAGAATITHARHADGLRRAVAALEAAVSGLENGGDAELVAEELRVAVHAIDALTGRIDVEAVLGEIFSNFCIGK